MEALVSSSTISSLSLSSATFNTSTVISVTVFVALLCLCIVIGHLLEENIWANESTISLLLGVFTGLVTLVFSKWKSSRILVFDEELFFLYLLPPIIFNAGFQVKKKQFFRNFSTILLFGVVGTLISFCIISPGAYFLFKEIGITSLRTQDYLAIGAIFSATDSVCTLQVLNQDQTPLLYSLVFGEGVVNDATSIVLFNATLTLEFKDLDALTALKLFGNFFYLFTTSTALGVMVGLASAFVIKNIYFGRHSTNREVAIMLLMAYLAYMVAELFSLSGIITIFFCGIVMSHYTWHNVTERSRVTTRHAFATMSFVAETFIFLYVGMDALDIDKWKTSHASVGRTIAASGTIFALVMIGRATFILSLANITNCFQTGTSGKLDLQQQFVIWWAGLMRGAVTVALSYEKFTSGSSLSEDGAFMITNSIVVVLFSNVVLGSMTKPLIQSMLSQHLKAQNPPDANVHSLEDLQNSMLEHDAAGEDELDKRGGDGGSSLRLLMRYPTSTIHHHWRRFDDRYMRPVFGGRGFVAYVPGTPRAASENNV